ncbi:thiopeptide-type bacteriocin biosynthesis protein [Ekhidna sp.]
MSSWISAHLFYNEPWEEFLVNGLSPFIAKVQNEQLISQFFFIRYWEKGPHIRLRMKGSSEELKPLIQSEFSQCFKKNPSHRINPEWLNKLPENQKWFQNNTIQFIAYEPEIDRYGGLKAIGIAERQFQYSSEAILDILRNSYQDWDYNKALGTAIQLHLGFAHGVGMSLKEAIAFYTKFLNNWLPRAYANYGEKLDQNEHKHRRKRTLDLFKENFVSHEKDLTPFFEQVWFALDEGDEFEQNWLNSWVRNMMITKRELLNIHTQKLLIKPEWYIIDSNLEEWVDHQLFWSVYESYIHMTNNRLGILNRDEGYLAYLIKESFSLLQKSHA